MSDLEKKVNAWFSEKGEGVELVNFHQTLFGSQINLTIFYKVVLTPVQKGAQTLEALRARSNRDMSGL